MPASLAIGLAAVEEPMPGFAQIRLLAHHRGDNLLLADRRQQGLAQFRVVERRLQLVEAQDRQRAERVDGLHLHIALRRRRGQQVDQGLLHPIHLAGLQAPRRAVAGSGWVIQCTRSKLAILGASE